MDDRHNTSDYWVATYNGDTNNLSAASGSAAEPVVVTPANPTVNSSQQPASATVGSSIADRATATGGYNPTGTATFKLYNNPTATGTPLFTSANVALSGGTAVSTGYTPTAVATVYWVVTYNGDTNNSHSPAALPQSRSSSRLPLPPSPPFSSRPAQLSAARLPTKPQSPAVITVTFNLYNNAGATGTPLFTGTETLSGGTATARSYTTVATGTVHWVATYNGDSNNSSVASGNSAEPVTVVPPSIYISDSQNNRIRLVFNGTITTFAGNGTKGFSGDGGPAASAELSNPYGVAVDASGNVYIADTLNNRVRMVNVGTGIINTVAGNGAPSYSGDNGPAVNAGLNNPTGVAVDASGNLYIADQRNNRIRLVNTSGVIATVAGNGGVGNSGDGGPATNAELYYPMGVALDSANNIYIADSDNQRIREVVAGGITTVAGTGNFGYNCNNGAPTGIGLHTPTGVALDSANHLYIADSANQCIREDLPPTLTTVAGDGRPSFSGDGGAATSAALNYPTAVALDPAGNLYIADNVNQRIRIVNLSGTIATFVGNGTAGFSGDGGPATGARLYNPTGVAIH